MKAPEKIWIDPATDLPKLCGHIDKDSVEYVHKDAFIGKTAEWLEDKLENYISCDGEWNVDWNILDDFIKYMEGE